MADEFRKAVRPLLRATVAQSQLVRAPLLGLVRAGRLPASVWRRLPVQGEFRVTAPDGRSFWYSSTPDDAIGRALFWTELSSWESETVAVFYRLAQKSKVVLDIGANTGVYTLLACLASDRTTVIAFEPVPRVYERLLRNVELNGWAERCDIRKEACSDLVASAKLHVPFGDVPTSASLHPDGFRGYPGDIVEIAATTVDAACTTADRVDLVKIDVEGFEDRVLRGMLRVLSQCRPKIVVECNPDGPFSAVEAILAELDYRFYHLRPEGPIPVGRIVPDQKQRYRNYLCSVGHSWDQ